MGMVPTNFEPFEKENMQSLESLLLNCWQALEKKGIDLGFLLSREHDFSGYRLFHRGRPSGWKRQQVAGEIASWESRKPRSMPFFSKACQQFNSMVSRDCMFSFSKGSKLVGTIPHTRRPPRSKNRLIRSA